jgi:integrase
VNERVHLEAFLYPAVGDVPLAEVTDVALIDWAQGLEKTHGPSGKAPSPKYIRKITATTRALFKDATRRHKIERTPCVWEDTDLPELEANARIAEDGFELQEVAQLIRDERIPEDRRVLYALEFLTGMRTGEAAARTWADWEPEYAGDLGRLVAKTSFNTRHHIVKATKTKVEKWIPVHPDLSRILADWKREGWQRFAGRDPTPEDLIVPAREGGHRNNSYSWRMFHQDLVLLGFRAQRHYESRATFINLAEGGGAQADVVRRITHPSIRDAKDLYSRARLRWPAMCAAVRCIRLLPPTNGEGDRAGDIAPNPLISDGRARESNFPRAVGRCAAISRNTNEVGHLRRPCRLIQIGWCHVSG